LETIHPRRFLKGIKSMLRSLLVPLDGSPFAEHALPLALSIARRAEAELQLVYVHRTSDEDHPAHYLLNEESLVTELKTRHRAYLDSVAQRLHVAGGKDVTLSVLHGDIGGSICKHVVEARTTLVVMTTHARNPLGRMWLGSVADNLVRELSRPLLLVRPLQERVDLSRDVALKHILIPLDGTPLAEQILEPAITLGEAMGAEYTLLRVIRPVTTVHHLPEGVGGAVLPEEMRQQIERVETQTQLAAEEYLYDMAQRLRGRLLRVHTKVVDEDQPALAVIEMAQKLPGSLVAMQTHGRRGLSRLVLGSVADKVLRGAATPLLVQRPST
jgi:nucleotide-binding universal stress UspA family protein